MSRSCTRSPRSSRRARSSGRIWGNAGAGVGSSKAAFEPATLTVKTGSVVRFINVSGGPHDIAFYTDSVPKGAVDALKKGMANTMGDLVGPFLTQPNEHYDVSFAGAPAGKYRGYCLPHVALGMHITITVQ